MSYFKDRHNLTSRFLLVARLAAALFSFVPASNQLLWASGDSALHAESEWIRSTTPNFTLYTTGDRDQAIALAQALNLEDSILKRSGLVTHQPINRLCVIAFKEEAEFFPYAPKVGAAGFFQPGRSVDYIVLKNLDPQKTRVAFHEYAHYLLKNSFPNLPLWLKEGIADVFSSTEWDGQEFRVGAPVPERVWALKNLPPIGLETLFTVRSDSPIYANGREGWSFYAQSWALAHMLMLSDGYSPKFSEFLSALASGQSAERAFQTTYGKNVAMVKKDLEHYWSQPMVGRVKSNLERGVAIDRTVANPTELEVDLALADVLASDPYRQPEAESRLGALSVRYPQNALIEESLAYLELQRHRTTEAQTHMLNAIRRGSLNRDLICRYLATRSDAGGLEESVSLLQRLLSIQPNDDAVRMLLATRAARIQKFELAVSTLKAIEAVPPQNAFRYFYLLAYCDVHLNDLSGGQADGLQAKRYASTSDELNQSEKLLRYVENVQIAGGAVHRAGSAD